MFVLKENSIKNSIEIDLGAMGMGGSVRNVGENVKKHPSIKENIVLITNYGAKDI